MQKIQYLARGSPRKIVAKDSCIKLRFNGVYVKATEKFIRRFLYKFFLLQALLSWLATENIRIIIRVKIAHTVNRSNMPKLFFYLRWQFSYPQFHFRMDLWRHTELHAKIFISEPWFSYILVVFYRFWCANITDFRIERFRVQSIV